MKNLFIILFIFVSFFVLGAEKEVIAVFNFSITDDEEKDVAIIATDNFIEALSNSGKYIIVERNALNKVFQEQNLSAGDEFDQSAAVDMGKVLGAKTVMIGSISLLEETYRITVRAINVETGAVRFSETITTKYLKYIPDRVKELGFTISYYAENYKNSFDMNVGASFNFIHRLKLGTSDTDYMLWLPIIPKISLVNIPASFSYFVTQQVAVGATLSFAHSISLIPFTLPLTRNDTFLLINSLELKLLFRLKALQSKRNVRFVFETGLFTIANFLVDFDKKVKDNDFAFEIGPVIHLGGEIRKSPSFSLETFFVFYTTFDAVTYSHYNINDGRYINIGVGAELRFNFYKLFNKQEKRLGTL